MVAVSLEEAIVCSLFQHRFFGDFNPCSFAPRFGALPLFFLFFWRMQINLLRMHFYLLYVVWGSKLLTVTTSFSMEIKNGRLANTKGRHFHHTLLSHHTTCHQWIASWHMPKHLLKTHPKTLYLSNLVVHRLMALLSRMSTMPQLAMTGAQQASILLVHNSEYNLTYKQVQAKLACPYPKNKFISLWRNW